LLKENTILIKNEYDSYTNKKYYILYLIMKKIKITEIIYVHEEQITEEEYRISIGLKDKEEIILTITKKENPKETTFLKKRIKKRLPTHLIRISNTEKILKHKDNKSLFTNYFYIEI